MFLIILAQNKKTPHISEWMILVFVLSFTKIPGCKKLAIKQQAQIIAVHLTVPRCYCMYVFWCKIQRYHDEGWFVY